MSFDLAKNPLCVAGLVVYAWASSCSWDGPLLRAVFDAFSKAKSVCMSDLIFS